MLTSSSHRNNRVVTMDVLDNADDYFIAVSGAAGSRTTPARRYVIAAMLLTLSAALIINPKRFHFYIFESKGRTNHEKLPQIVGFDQRNRSQLASITLARILNNSEEIPSNNSAAYVSFVPPCEITNNVIESTSSLLVAEALTKADNETLHVHNIWHYFNALFTVPSSSGFIPKYLYPIHKYTSSESNYIPQTRIPNWNFFFNHNKSLPLPCAEGNKNQTFCWIGSGRISATPFHATTLLELVLYLERQDRISSGELSMLCRYWNHVFSFHEYIHEVVMRGCDSGNQTADGVPCYNILHPWESMITMSSHVWKEVLNPAKKALNALNWSVPFDIPEHVKNSYDYDEDIYAASVFLAECLSNQTFNASAGYNYPYTFHEEAVSYEDQIIKMCPFAMLDLGYASALAQADDDLYNVALWLRQRNVAISTDKNSMFNSPSWNAKLAKFSKWKDQSRHVMYLLWDRNKQSYVSKYATSYTDEEFPTMSNVKAPVANNLMVFWQQIPDNAGNDDSHWDRDAGDHLQQMAQQMLRHDGQYSFDCNGFPLWSGGCTDPQSIIDPVVDYYVGLGLLRNRGEMAAFGDYLTNATIDLILKDSVYPLANVSFQEAYPTNTSDSFYLDRCGMTSTVTSAILYHLLLDEFDFSFELPIPPIRNSWIVTLITAELMFAFGVGLSCICLSLSLIRQENNRSRQDNSDSYVAIEERNTDHDEDVDSIPELENDEA